MLGGNIWPSLYRTQLEKLAAPMLKSKAGQRYQKERCDKKSLTRQLQKSIAWLTLKRYSKTFSTLYNSIVFPWENEPIPIEQWRQSYLNSKKEIDNFYENHKKPEFWKPVLEQEMSYLNNTVVRIRISKPNGC